MKLSDKKIIEFLFISPIKDFSVILETLRYLDGRWEYEDIEYELFHEALGDNPNKKINIHVPSIKGVQGNVLLNLTWHAKKFNLIRRRVRKIIDFGGQADELVVFYELTPKGKEVMSLLEAIERAKILFVK